MQVLRNSDPAQQAAQYLAEHKIIEDEKKPLYAFGIRLMMDIALNVATTCLIAACFHMLWQMILFTAVYLSLRSYAGGYHASTRLNCYLFSAMITIFAIYAIGFVAGYSPVCFVAAVGEGGLIFFLAPVENRKKPLRENERKVYRKRIRILICIDLLLAAALTVIGYTIFLEVVVVAFAVICFMLVLELKNRSRQNQEQ